MGKPSGPTSFQQGQQRFQQRNPSQALVAEKANEEESADKGGFNNNEIEKLRKLLGSLENTSGTCSLALSGIYLNPLYA